MFGQENTVMVPKVPLITSNEQIFPSLHPFGPRYSQRPINGKRCAEMAFSLQKIVEPRKMIHSPASDAENMAQSPSHELKNEETEQSGFKVPKIPQPRKNAEKKSLRVIENDTNSSALDETDPRLTNNGLNFGSFSFLSMLMNPERLHMEMIKQSLQMNLQTLLMSQISNVKNLNYPTEQNTPSEQTAPESEKSERSENMDQENCSEEETDKETTDESPTAVLPGFNDKNETKVLLGQNVQAVIPPSKNKSNRKGPKLVWNADDEETQKLEVFHVQVEELLEISISDQEKVSQILKENDNDVKKALAKIEKSKGRYRFAFKIKRNITPKQPQDFPKSE